MTQRPKICDKTDTKPQRSNKSGQNYEEKSIKCTPSCNLRKNCCKCSIDGLYLHQQLQDEQII